MRTLRGIGFTLEQTANKHNDVQSVRRCCIYIISSLGSGMVIKSYDKSVIRSSGNECDESTSVKINSLSPSLPLICHETQLNEFSFSTDNIDIFSPKRQHAGVCLYLQYDLQSPVSSHVIEYMMFMSQKRSII